MTKLPALKPAIVAKTLKKAGFTERNTKGSNRIYCHPDGRRTTYIFSSQTFI